MNDVVIRYLKKLGYSPLTSYYPNIRLWRSWWENHVEDFHTYHDHNGVKREISKLAMAKKVCEDWSSILFTERDILSCNDKNNQNYLNSELKHLKFNDEISNNIETSFWSGTVATVIRVYNAMIEQKQLISNNLTSYELVNVSAEHIVPLRILNKKIVDIAFVSEDIEDDKKIYYVEIHILTLKGYKISNIYLNDKGKEIKKEGVAKEYNTYSDIPLFNLYSPKILNNIRDNNGLGISILANAISPLKTCDLAYNNFDKDLYLGGKKVFYNKKLTKYVTTIVKDKNGESVSKEVPIFPDDLTKQQFQVVGDEMDGIEQEPLIKEYNPDLRVDDNERAINMALNILSFRVGLGKGYYKFENGTVVTATQYLGENKDLINNASKHRTSLNEYTVGIARSILLIGRLLFGAKTNENDTIALTDLDGFLVSDEEKQQQYRDDFNLGVMSKISYLMKARGMSQKQAQAELDLVKKENPSVKDLVGE